MRTPTLDILTLLQAVNRRFGQATSLAAMAEIAHRSPWSLHRLFRRVTGETPKGYDLRVRLDRAAAQLVSSDDAVSRIAFDNGFASHEVFSRTFRKRFDTSPSRYRARGLIGVDRLVTQVHADAVHDVSPCLGLYRLSTTQEGTSAMAIDVQIEDRPEFTALVISRRTVREDIADVLGECLPRVFGYAMDNGLAMTGPPMARYPEVGMASLVIECGVPIAEPPAQAPGDDIEVRSIPAGPTAVAIHHGHYDELGVTYRAIEEWLDSNGYLAAGPLREVYLTDPGEHPDPATWQTEIAQPVVSRDT